MCCQIDKKCKITLPVQILLWKVEAEFSFDDDDDVANFGNLSTIGGGLGPGI